VQLSRYALLLRDVAPGEHVLYDVIGDRYAGVDDRLLAALARWKTAPPAPGEEEQAAAALGELGLVVPDGAADAIRLAEHLGAVGRGPRGAAFVTLMPTLACNLACTYCFQKDHPAYGRMSEATEAATLAFVERHLDANRPSELVVHYFGGEPLLRKDFLLRTVRAFEAVASARGISFRWQVTTNGSASTSPSRGRCWASHRAA